MKIIVLLLINLFLEFALHLLVRPFVAVAPMCILVILVVPLYVTVVMVPSLFISCETPTAFLPTFLSSLCLVQYGVPYNSVVLNFQ